MALGMADVIQNAASSVKVDAMFIDEGFGSLDEESRTRAVQVLQELSGGRRLIGIISHVTELKEEMGHKTGGKKGKWWKPGALGDRRLVGRRRALCDERKELFTYDNRNSRDGDDIDLISVYCSSARRTGGGENAGI